MDGKTDLLNALLWAFDGKGVSEAELSRLICPPLSKALAIALLARIGEMGRSLREFLILSEVDLAKPIPPISLVQYPTPTVFYPDGAEELISESGYGLLKILVDGFPNFVSLGSADYRVATLMSCYRDTAG